MKKIILVIFLSLVLVSCEKEVQENVKIEVKKVEIKEEIQEVVSDELIEEEVKEFTNTGISLEMERNTNLKWQSRDEIDFIKNVREELIKIGRIKIEGDILFNDKGIFLEGKKFEILKSFKEHLFRLQEKYYYKYEKYNDGILEIDFHNLGYYMKGNTIFYGKYTDFGRHYNLGQPTYAIEISSIDNFNFYDLLYEGGYDYISEIIYGDICKGFTLGGEDHFGGSNQDFTSTKLVYDGKKYNFTGYGREGGGISTLEGNNLLFNSNKIDSIKISNVNTKSFVGLGLPISNYFSFILSGAKNNSKELLEIAYNLKYKPTQTLEQFIETYKGVKKLEIENIEDIGENKYKTLVNIDGTKYESIFEIVEEYKIKTISVTLVK